MNTEERQLAEMLHRVTPEPPRRVTVEDVAFRLANEAGQARGGHPEPRLRRGPGRGNLGRGRGWAPVLAAASVVVVAGASAGIATVMTSQRGHTTSLRDNYAPLVGLGVDPGDLDGAGEALPSTGPPRQPEPNADGMWGAQLIRPSVADPSLAGRRDQPRRRCALRHLPRLPEPGSARSPGTCCTRCRTPRRSLASRTNGTSTGSTVWVLSSYSGSSVVLTGYNGKTLAPAGTVTVPVSGQLSSAPQGVLTKRAWRLPVRRRGQRRRGGEPGQPPGGEADRHIRAG